MLGDMYEANILEKLCKPIYWTDKPWRIMRGTWFEVCGEKWYPLEEQDSSRVELEHCRPGWRNKASRQMIATSSDPTKSCDVVLNKLSLEKYEVLWMADDTIFKQKKEITSQLWSMVGEKLGKGQAYGAARLKRGYKDAASHEHRDPPIGHLVLIVHGIGQCSGSADICKDTKNLRSSCIQVAKKHFPDEWAQKRVEFLPCEWRTWLTLDKGVLNTITPHGVKMVREAINESAIDVMYYLSPKYGPEIMDGLRFSLHKQYDEFMKRNPHFDGTVSVFAHSLGSVLVYDILLETCEVMGIEHSDIEPPKPANGATAPKRAVELHSTSAIKYNCSAQSFTSSMQSSNSQQHGMFSIEEGQDEVDFTVSGGGDDKSVKQNGTDTSSQSAARMELEQLKLRVAELEAQLGARKKQGLKFTLDHFFAVGSPLPLFLLMKEHECLIKKGHRGAASLLPPSICKRVHNVNHPSDPIAYRLEPLVNPLYAKIKPVKLDSASSKPSKESVDLAQGPQEERKPPPPTKSWSFNPFSSSSKKTESPPQPTKVPDGVLDDDKSLREDDRLKERLDFMLRESIAEISYINAIKSHLSYWTSLDCAQYLLLQIYTYKKSE